MKKLQVSEGHSVGLDPIEDEMVLNSALNSCEDKDSVIVGLGPLQQGISNLTIKADGKSLILTEGDEKESTSDELLVSIAMKGKHGGFPSSSSNQFDTTKPRPNSVTGRISFRRMKKWAQAKADRRGLKKRQQKSALIGDRRVQSAGKKNDVITRSTSASSSSSLGNRGFHTQQIGELVGFSYPSGSSGGIRPGRVGEIAIHQ